MTTKKPWILGINASHNGAACLLHDGNIVVAIQEERLTRIKKHRVSAAYPANCITYCLDHSGISPEDLDVVAVSCQSRQDAASQDIYRNPQLRLRTSKASVIYVPNHAAHAVGAYATSGFSEAAILVIDGMGSHIEDWWPEEQKVISGCAQGAYEMISMYYACGTELTCLGKQVVPGGRWLIRDRAGMPRFRSLGGMYAAASYQIFGKSSAAGKVMGLAPFGEIQFGAERFWDLDRDCNLHFVDEVPIVLGSEQRWPANVAAHQNLACSTQNALDQAVLALAAKLRELSGADSLCYAGGVALNGITNELLTRRSGFSRVHVMPSAEDNGAAIGAAFWAHWRLTREWASTELSSDALGRTYTDDEIRSASRNFPDVELETTSDTVKGAVDLLCSGAKIGLFVGGSEFGPRALGHRSILSDPRDALAKNDLNERVKRREEFRPFAAAILREESCNWFECRELGFSSPFMLRILPFQEDQGEKVPAVRHVDNTTRPQTLTSACNGMLHEIVQSFYGRTGVPMVLNTSFNGPNEPIVETPTDALNCMLSNGIDACVFPSMIALRAQT